MDYLVYVYGDNGMLAQKVFNGIARMFASNSQYFTKVGGFSMAIGAIWATTRAMFSSNISIFGKQWFLPAFLSFTLLFSPKTTVWIMDETSNQNYKVDNIPFAIGFFSGISSSIARAMTKEIEKEFSTLDGSAPTNGTWFGAKLVSKIKDVKIQDPVVLGNTKEFLRQCFIRPWIMGNILDKRLEAESTTNLLEFLKTNTAKGFGMYYDVGGRKNFISCANATTKIVPIIEKQINREGIFDKILLSVAGQGAATTSQSLVARFLQDGGAALKSLGRKTTDAGAWVQQAMMLNAYRESLDDWRDGLGMNRLWPELISMNATRGIYQQSFGWLTAGEMAGQTLALMQTVIFLIITVAIVVVFPFSQLVGGYEILKMWIQSMIWVQTWPIFFAIIHCIGMNIMATKSKALGNGYGLDKFTQEDYSEMLVQTYAICQMFASMVPILAWMFVSKSSYAFSGMVERLSSAGVAGSIGASTADGTMNMDSISYGNKYIGQQIVGPRLDTSSSMNDGRFNTTYASNGEQFVDERGSQLLENYRGSAMLSQMLQQSYQGSVSDLNSLSTQESMQTSRVNSARQHYAENFSMDKGAMSNASKQVAEAMQIVANNGASLNENVSENQSKGTSTHSGMGVDAGANVGDKVGIISGFLGANAKTGTSATNNDAVSKDSSHQSSMRFEEAASIVDNYAKSHNMSESSSERQEAGNSLNTELSKMEQISEQKAAVQQKVESLSNQIAFTSQQSSSIDKNYNDEVLDQVMKSHGLTNKAAAAQYLSEHRPEGQEILKSLVERDSGVGMSGIGNIAEARNMSHKVHNSTNFEPPVYKKGAEALEKGYNESSEVDNRANEVKYGVEENQDLVRTAVGTNPQYTVDGKTPQEVRDAVQGGKADLDNAYKKTPDSTILRTGEQAWQNTDNVLDKAARAVVGGEYYNQSEDKKKK